MLARCMARTISIVGAGRVGKALGKRLRELGWRIGAVVTRSARTSRAAVRAIGAGTPCANLTEVFSSHLPQDRRAGLQPRRKPARSAAPMRSHTRGKYSLSRRVGLADAPIPASSGLFDADVMLLTTPDDVLSAVAQSLSPAAGRALRGKIVLHTSATLDRSVLDPFARLGAFTGSLHPMQAFDGKTVPKLHGVIFAIEGDPGARRVARSIAKSLGGVPIAIDTRDKPIYHASAVLAAGSAYPLIEAGVRMLMRIGFTRARAMQTLLPLIRQILDNIERVGPRAAWTGPLSRGDYAVVAKHARALRRYPREFGQSYAALALLAGRVIARNPAATLKQIKRALGNDLKV
jgi:predicted short-subunit dehydrogenase-like oxidoreductase (DUF2520 family)